MLGGIFSWIFEWLLKLIAGYQGRVMFAFLIFFLIYTLFTFWSYRFSIRAVGVREATYGQSVAVRLVDVVLLLGLFFTGLLVPWGIPVILIARVLAFYLLFKAEFGKALFGVLLSMLMGAVFTAVYMVVLLLWAWFTWSLPF